MTICQVHNQTHPCIACQAIMDEFVKRRLEMGHPPQTFATKFAELLEEAETDANYDELHRILNIALVQSACGKGKDRHNKAGVEFDKQQIVNVPVIMGSTQYPIGQANKKIFESLHLEPQKAIHELLGAIVYLAAAIRTIEILHRDKLTDSDTYVKANML